MSKLTIHTDGGSRGNPGPAASAAVFLGPDNQVVLQKSHFLGTATNNEAEYQAVTLALEHLVAHKADFQDYSAIDFVLDSELVVKQLTGLYKIKKPELQQIASTIFQLIRQLKQPVSFRHVKRHLNHLPDTLLNQELDRQ